MSKMHRKNLRGFSLVELLAVVLVIAVLAAVAIPLYLNTRKEAAARTCKGNLAMIARAEAVYVVRNGAYASYADLTDGTKVSEALNADIRCPLDATGTQSYSIATTQGGTTGITTGATTAAYVNCKNATDHASATGATTATAWQIKLDAPSTVKDSSGL